MNLKILSIAFALICTFSSISAQNMAAAKKVFEDQINALPVSQFFKKNRGVGLFGSSQEGMQVVSKQGRFGYIDKKFDWKIAPQYDWAFPFNEGFGIVFLDEKPQFIDKNGQKPFKTDFAKDLAPFHNGRALFRTWSDKMGMLDKQGRLVADTVYNKIYTFENDSRGSKGMYMDDENRTTTIVTRGAKKGDLALMDTAGKLVVPFGAFDTIEFMDIPFGTETNFYKASHADYVALFDFNGKEFFRLETDSSRGFQLPEYLHVQDGLVQVRFNKTAQSNGHDTRYGLINFKGEWVLNDPEIQYILDFDQQNAFISDINGELKLIKLSNGEEIKILPKPTLLPRFKDLKKYGMGVADANVLLDKRKSGIIDSCFTWKISPQYDQVQFQNHPHSAPYFILTNQFDTKEAKEKNIKQRYKQIPARLSGLADLKGKILFEPKFQNISPMDSFLQKFHFTSADGKIGGEMDRNGKVLRERQLEEKYEEKYINKGSQTPTFNLYKIDWKIKIDDEKCGATKDVLDRVTECNRFEKLSYPSAAKSLHIVIEGDSMMSKLNNNHSAIKAKLVNATTEKAYFQTLNQILHLKIEAQDAQGNWRAISYIQQKTRSEKQRLQPEKTLGLPPQYFWELELPTFDGCVKTQFRCLILTGKEGEKPIVSDTWEGGVNPAQFWKHPFYEPNRLFTTFSFDILGE